MKSNKIKLLFLLVFLNGTTYSQNNYTPFETDLEVIKLFDNKKDTVITEIFDFQLRDTVLNNIICFYDGFITEAQKTGDVIHLSHYTIDANAKRIKISNTILFLSDGCYKILEYFDSDLSGVKSVEDIKGLTVDAQLYELFLGFLKTHNYVYLDDFMKIMSSRKYQDLYRASVFQYFLYTRRFLKKDSSGNYIVNRKQNFTTEYIECSK